MFKYLWMVTQDLFLAVTLTTIMHVYLSRTIGGRGRTLHRAGLAAGTLASIALAAVKYNTKLIMSSHWNHYTYPVILGSGLLVLLFSVLAGRRENAGEGKGGAVLCIAGSVLSAVLVFYFLPGVLLYPFSFNTMGQGYLSTYYLVRMAGWLGALVLLLVYSRLLSRCALQIKPFRLLPAGVGLGLAPFMVYCFGRYFAPWVSRAKWLNWPVRYSDEAYGWIGRLVMLTTDYAMLYIWIAAGAAALLAVMLFRQGTVIRETYDNSAQLRKLRARNRHRRRVAAGLMICILLCVVTMTAVKTEDTRVVELSAPETYTADEAAGEIRIAMEDVSDGHLHRFEYRTEKNIDVRWIVVKKPGSASFGVGLDACEVCGNAGYFERNGQVICKRCDVVMNINTIGFKGGCNPIPLAYEVRDGNLVFRLSDLAAAEKEFR